MRFDLPRRLAPRLLHRRLFRAQLPAPLGGLCRLDFRALAHRLLTPLPVELLLGLALGLQRLRLLAHRLLVRHFRGLLGSLLLSGLALFLPPLPRLLTHPLLGGLLPLPRTLGCGLLRGAPRLLGRRRRSFLFLPPALQPSEKVLGLGQLADRADGRAGAGPADAAAGGGGATDRRG